MGYFESRVAIILAHFIEKFLEARDLGIVLGADALLRIAPSRTRAPDLSFFRWEKFPQRQLPAEPVPSLIPDLAVEVISRGNTRAEIETKLDEYFAAGVLAAWIIDPQRQRAEVYTARHAVAVVENRGALRAESVLPGFELPLQDLFDRAGQRRAK